MIPTVRFDAGEAFTVAKDLGAVGPIAAVRVGTTVRHFGLLLQTKVKAHASKPRTGPPGPRIITGDYNRSIALSVGLVAGAPTATVGTNKPQGRRLEFGFTGIDAIGRSYDQPPYPHFGPALAEVAPLFVAALERIDLDPGAGR